MSLSHFFYSTNQNSEEINGVGKGSATAITEVGVAMGAEATEEGVAVAKEWPWMTSKEKKAAKYVVPNAN